MYAYAYSTRNHHRIAKRYTSNLPIRKMHGVSKVSLSIKFVFVQSACAFHQWVMFSSLAIL